MAKRGKEMSMAGHLVELRKRLLVALVAFLAASIAAFSYAEPLADYLMRPAGDLSFVFLSPPELFMAYVKIALVAGLCVSLPVILHQLWGFVAPALSRRERAGVVLSLLFGALLFALGSAFSFYVILPLTLKFFFSYTSARVQAFISISDYLGFVSGLVFSFGAAFELPMLAAALGALGVLRAETLAKGRRLALLGIFVAAAILTPPDVVSQVLLALPMLGLYELSLVILRIQGRRRDKRLAAAEAAAAEG